MNYVFNQNSQECNNSQHRQGINGNGIKCSSELIFSKCASTPVFDRHRPFNKRLSKKIAQAESLHLYHQLNITDEKEDFNEIRNCSHTGNDVARSLPSSQSSGTISTCNSMVSSHYLPVETLSESTFPNTESLRCKEKSKARKFGGSIRKLFSPTATRDTAKEHISSSPTLSLPSPASFRVGSSAPPLQRSYSLSHSTKYPRRRRLSLFVYGTPDIMSTSLSSIQSSPAPSGDVKVPSPTRFTAMYDAVRQAISEHISVNTAELNVLQMRQQEPQSLNAAQTYDIEKLTTYFERVIKKLQYQQTQLDEIHESYVLQQRYREGAVKLKSALTSSRVSSRSSKLELKADLNRSTETLCSLEQELVALLGRFHFEMKGLLGFAKLRSGDQYEIVLRLGAQKWRMRGAIRSFNDQSWDNDSATMQPLLSDVISVKVMEVKLLGKHSTVGNVVCETKDLFKVEPQDLTIELNDTATLKLNLKVQWVPFDGYETPVRAQNAPSSWTSDFARSRAKSVVERPISTYVSTRVRLPSALSRPVSAIYPPSANANNCNNRLVIPIQSGEVSTVENENQYKNSNRNTVLSEEDAFLEAISKNHRCVCEEKPVEAHTTKDTLSKRRRRCLSRKLAVSLVELNLELDDYRGRYQELFLLEDIVIKLLEKLKIQSSHFLSSDGFSVQNPDEDKQNDVSSRDSMLLEDNFPTTGLPTCDEALIAHLKTVRLLLKNVGVFGPLKMRELLALDKLPKQARILSRISQIAASGKEISFDDMKEFSKRRTLLEMWRSCCDGNTSLCVSAKTFRLELTSAFGRNVRAKHAEVADEVFPELIHRIFGRNDVTDNDTVTLFHVSSYVDDVGENEDLEKLVEKLALEMFISTTLSCGAEDLVLVAIKRVSSLLALRTSNLRALSHLLLDSNPRIRTAAAAHIRHISTDQLLRDKAFISFAELLESGLKMDRQCACIALGFLGARECIPQLAYIYQSDIDIDVREASSNVLLSMGDDGADARDYVSVTLLTQTMTQQVAHGNAARMGTAL